VPNVLRILALRPRHLLAWWGYYDELLRGESRLTKAQREAIAVVVSKANDCHY
jgi:alkylhydroperoxidase family enzyme